MFDSLDNTLSILALLVIVVAYSTAGGIRGVVLTDLLQFAIAMVASVLFAWHAVDHVGGLEALWSALERQYPEGPGVQPSHRDLVRFWPAWGRSGLMSFGAFAAGLGVLWWANSRVDGSGYLAQRINTAKTGRDAEWGALWFCFVNSWCAAGPGCWWLWSRWSCFLWALPKPSLRWEPSSRATARWLTPS